MMPHAKSPDRPPAAGNFARYPPTTDRSLRVMSAADELLLEWGAQQLTAEDQPLVIHDRFGAVTLSLPGHPVFLSSFHSQEEALRRNASSAMPRLATVFDHSVDVRHAVMRVPKSLELWEVYLATLAHAAAPDLQVAAGFMTKYFTPRLLEVAGKYAGTVRQSRARKKARLLMLSDFIVPDGSVRPPSARVPCKSLGYASRVYRQYYGVFSGDHIDYATQFLLEQWEALALPAQWSPARVLDIGCGNGIIGGELLVRYAGADLTATDDALLAVESARLNLPTDRATVLYDHSLVDIPSSSHDLVVTNPPFHFGHENNIEVSLELFRQAHRILSPGGYLVVVANRHLNYGSHLVKWFAEVGEPAVNDKYVVYRCRH
ncbi:class I SAM-dependent methyltransferase [Neolewinella litorea]|uniref:Methyltransferase domain-containing protein n=1 Tax=Neolewinella litorea TaxID=2562452 RepID=A0A4S4NP98_9BACT|nr:methyltransferase [Neolewinella litorea]THH41722.1 methyltransferase domain-containing protein [Neolewinella litorea]